MERLTKQRQAILSFLERTHDHPTADEVYAAVQPQLPRLSLATVYRTLDTLVAEGLANRVPGTQPARFEIHQEGHVHFQCTCCGKMLDLWPTSPLVDLTLIGASGPEVTGYDLMLRGLCPECKKTNS